MSDLTPQQVIEAFGRFTAIKFRVVPHSVQRQAVDFVRNGFTLQELELVIKWTRRQIEKNQGGYSAASLQWRVLFGDHGAADEWVCFQERLGLAELALKSGWRPKLEAGEQKVEPGKKTVSDARPSISPEDEDRLRQQRKAQMEELKKNLNRS